MALQGNAFELEKDEQVTALEDELRALRYAQHSLTHAEPDDITSRAYERWKERQEFLSGQIEDVESELRELQADDA